MGQLIKTTNFYNLLIAPTKAKKVFVDTEGTTKTIGMSSSSEYGVAYGGPFYINGEGTISSISQWSPYVYASSNSTIPTNTYAVTNQVGTCTITYSFNANQTGWNALITIAGSEYAEVNSLYFVKAIKTGSTSANAVLFCYLLDNTIKLTSDNNYMASLSMGIAYEQ